MPTRTTPSAAVKATANGPSKPSRRDTLHIAYNLAPELDGFVDVVVFGTRPEALEHAIEQSPPWKVAAIRKGQTLRDAIGTVIAANLEKGSSTS